MVEKNFWLVRISKKYAFWDALAFNYPDVRYSGVSLYIANRFLRQSKEGKGYHQMQSTVHGSGIP